MRKTISVVLLLCLVLSLWPLSAYAVQEEDACEDVIRPAAAESGEAGDLSPDELAYRYLLQRAREGTTASLMASEEENAGSRLTGLDKGLYDSLARQIKEVAAGTRTSTSFTVSAEEMGITGQWYSAGDLGVSEITEGYSPEARNALTEKLLNHDTKPVIHALLGDYPYEMYWYDKTTGNTRSPRVECTFKTENGETFIGYGENTTYQFMLSVADEYAGTETFSSANKVYNIEFSPGKANSWMVDAATAKANQIVSENANKNDYEKLLSYRDAICELVEYNHDAANNNGPYGNTSQLIFVFDGDPDTNVVCEGYAKAFQFLCDLTDFDADIQCYSVSGYLSGSSSQGPHMWNLVRMEDGTSYLADVTCCDGSSEDAQYGWFLAGCSSGDVSSGYTIEVTPGTLCYYAYDTSKMQTLYGPDLLTLSSSHYEYSEPAPGIEGTWGNNVNWKIRNGVLRIEGNGPIDDCGPTGLLYPWQDYGEEVTSIIIGDGITSIPRYAFRDFIQAKDISLPSSAKEFGYGCFQNTPWLADLSENGYVIVNNVLLAYEGKEDYLVVPEGITDICEGLWFAPCTTVLLPESLTTLSSDQPFVQTPLNRIIFKGTKPELRNENLWDNCFGPTKVEVYYPEIYEDWADTWFSQYTGDEGTRGIPYVYIDSRGEPVVSGDPNDAEDPMFVPGWKDKCTVSFLAGEGAGSMEPQEAEKGTSFQLPDCQFQAPENRIFRDWEINGTPYQPGDLVTIESDTTVYAKWAPYYTVTFDANGGTGEMEAITVCNSSQVELPDCAFAAPEGMTFKAWAVNGTEYAPGVTVELTGSITLIAVWESQPEAADPYVINEVLIYEDQSSTFDIVVSVTQNQMVSGNVVVASYTPEGQFIAMAKTGISSSGSLYLKLNCENAGRVVVFVVDDDFSPLADNLNLPL